MQQMVMIGCNDNGRVNSERRILNEATIGDFPKMLLLSMHIVSLERNLRTSFALNCCQSERGAEVSDAYPYYCSGIGNTEWLHD
jgi:hypothetical protein